MAGNNIQDMPITILPKTDNELALLKNYHAYLADQVNGMELHPSHKHDVQKVLTNCINKVLAHSAPRITPVNKSFFARVSRRVFG